MSTTIKDPDGELLWQADDFGKYSVMKTGAIAEIIAELMRDITVKVETYIADDDKALANVYSRTQADERFVQLVSFPEFLEGQVYKLIMEGEIVGIEAIDLVNSRLLLLFKSCFGTDLDGNRVQVGFDSRIQTLEDTSEFLYDRVTKISRDIYLIRDGEVDVNVLVIAKLADTGLRENLDPDIPDTSTMVAAINAVNQKINTSIGDLSDLISRVGDLETQAGDEHLDTISQTLSGAINEIHGIQGTTSQTVDTLRTDVGNLSTTVGDLSTDVGTAKGDISNLQSAMGTAQGDIGTLQTDVGNVQGDVSGLQTDVGNLQGDVSGLSGDVGDVDTLDSGFTTKEVVAALNQLITAVGNLSSQISGLDSRVSDLESRI